MFETESIREEVQSASSENALLNTMTDEEGDEVTPMAKFEKLLEEVMNAPVDDILLDTVTDENGDEVKIVQSIIKRKDGTILDNSIFALNAETGFLYPVEESGLVGKAIERLIQKKKRMCLRTTD